ncbi:MAG: glycosyltransferase [Endomicrobia bacterium]|nr:glycosyltransferase [Endomicrobiia bacterium]MDW8056218.1 glycosyltransferase [Elusimicrobiota bacterium]
MMKISGATIVKNAVLYGYPIVESIKSLLPLVDEYVVNIGKSQDDTKKLIESIKDPKIKIIETEWDESIRTGGLILSIQTNYAIKHCTGDWIFYLQADEVLHEDDYDEIYNTIKVFNDDQRVDGFAFNFLHFYGSAWTYKNARNWYKNEVRIIRNNGKIFSYGDAQSFRLIDGEKPKAKLINARIFHYGWARPHSVLIKKVVDFNKLWHNDEYIVTKFADFDIYKCLNELDNLEVFTGRHPKVMMGNKEFLSLENFLFIMQLREKYIKQRSILQYLKALSKKIPIGRYRGFKKI